MCGGESAERDGTIGAEVPSLRTWNMEKKLRTLRSIGALLVLLALGSGSLAIAADAPKKAPTDNGPLAPPDGCERGVTKPTEEPKQAFSVPGIVDKVLVKEGDEVKEGQVMAELDMREEQAKMLEMQGDVVGAEFQIKAAIADHDAKQVAYQRKLDLYAEQLKANPKFTNSELDEARVAVEIAVIAKDFRAQEKTQKQQELKSLAVKMDMKRLTSRVTGVVSSIDLHPGEAADLSKPAITVIKHDKLFVEVDVPVTKTRKLKKDDALKVCYTDDYNEQADKVSWMDAKVVFLSPYADASSGTRKVRLEMNNKPEGSPAPVREAGLTVYVRVSDTPAAASR
jgi:RND family efflux transporter MFP subunit